MNIKNTFTALLIVAVMAAIAPPEVKAQGTATTKTYTTAALSANITATAVTVASATGMAASTNAVPTYIAICDGPFLPPSSASCELMKVTAINSLVLTVQRGQNPGSNS